MAIWQTIFVSLVAGVAVLFAGGTYKYYLSILHSSCGTVQLNAPNSSDYVYLYIRPRIMTVEYYAEVFDAPLKIEKIDLKDLWNGGQLLTLYDGTGNSATNILSGEMTPPSGWNVKEWKEKIFEIKHFIQRFRGEVHLLNDDDPFVVEVLLTKITKQKHNMAGSNEELPQDFRRSVVSIKLPHENQQINPLRALSKALESERRNDETLEKVQNDMWQTRSESNKKSQMNALYHFAGSELMNSMKLTGSSARAVISWAENRAKEFGEHRCHYTTCHFVNHPEGKFDDIITGAEYESKGEMYICHGLYIPNDNTKLLPGTLRIHVCDMDCDEMEFDGNGGLKVGPNGQVVVTQADDTGFCPISMRVKPVKKTRMPKYDDLPVSTSKLNQIQQYDNDSYMGKVSSRRVKATKEELKARKDAHKSRQLHSMLDVIFNILTCENSWIAYIRHLAASAFKKTDGAMDMSYKGNGRADISLIDVAIQYNSVFQDCFKGAPAFRSCREHKDEICARLMRFLELICSLPYNRKNKKKGKPMQKRPELILTAAFYAMNTDGIYLRYGLTGPAYSSKGVDIPMDSVLTILSKDERLENALIPVDAIPIVLTQFKKKPVQITQNSAAIGMNIIKSCLTALVSKLGGELLESIDQGKPAREAMEEYLQKCNSLRIS